MDRHSSAGSFASPDAPFSQRMTYTFEDSDRTMSGKAKLSYDDVTWNDDLEITYRRSVVTGPRSPQDVPSTSRSTAIGSSVFDVMRDIHGIIGRAGLQPPCFGLRTRRASEGKWKLLTPSLEARQSAPETRVARVGQRPGMTAEGSPVVKVQPATSRSARPAR